MLTKIDSLKKLKDLKDTHPFWENSLFKAVRAGELTISDYTYIWGQYLLYSQNFTRYLAGVMAATESDYYRSCLSENLWEEGGGSEPQLRHSEIFRRFLAKLDLDINKIDYADFTRLFVQQYLYETTGKDVIWSTAFLSLGTEAIVSQMYEIFIDGMRKAGMPNEWLHFFHLHVACDDAHAATLEEMLLSFSAEPTWLEQSYAAIDKALTLRSKFFESLHLACLEQRLSPTLERIKQRQSLSYKFAQLHQAGKERGELHYSNECSRLGIEFSVEKFPFKGEVIEPRIVRVPVAKKNEMHRHAHETLYYVIKGNGRVQVDHCEFVVAVGDTVFIPRWAVHQTHNIGIDELVLLAVTDFGLTGNYLGDYDKNTRMKQV